MVAQPLTLTLTDTGFVVDLTGQKIKVIKQVSDWGDITKQHTSYSWVFDVEKTPENTNALQGLGLPGDASTFPYSRIDCFLTFNGTVIEPNGRLTVKETQEDKYRLYVQAGIIDFYRDIADDKISEVIDLSELDHENTVNNITASFNQDTYRYIIASYGGPPLADVAGLTNLSPFALVPSVNILYLWDAVMAYYGWTYTLPSNVQLGNKWLSYPNATTYDDGSLVAVGNFEQDADIFLDWSTTGQYYELPYETTAVDSEWVEALPSTAPNIGERMRILQPGTCRISMYHKGRIRFNHRELGGNFYAAGRISIWHNGVKVAEEQMDNEAQEGTVVVDRIVQTGDILETKIQPSEEFSSDPNFYPVEVFYYEGDFALELTGVQDVSFSSALIKVKVREFFKEVMLRHGLTVFPDVENKNLLFKTIKQRVEAVVLDWTDVYVRRKKEQYAIPGTAQNNYLRHKYNKENEDHADGNLQVNNQNLESDKDLYKSITYAQELELVQYISSTGTFNVPVFTMFEIKVEEDPDTGDLIADYEPLKDRFYIMESEDRTGDIYILGNLVSEYPVAIPTGNTFSDIVDIWYSEAPQIYQDARVLEIELEITEYRLAQLDLSKLYYFEQEKNYFILQKLTYEPGALSSGTFIRVDYLPTQSTLSGL